VVKRGQLNICSGFCATQREAGANALGKAAERDATLRLVPVADIAGTINLGTDRQ
jgi:hypothetical protein